MRPVLAAFRRVWLRPSFALSATATLALGIAAPTALFAVLYATLLRPLPYPDARDIYAVRTRMTDGRFTIGLLASEEMSALRRAAGSVVASALTIRRDDVIVAGDQSRQVTCVGVSEGFFDLFGLPMAAGRPFTADDYAAPYGSRAILSHRAWQTLFGADPHILNTSIRFGSSSALVVGVAPDAFAIPAEADLWIAQHNVDSIGHGFDAYVRLAPGITPDVLEARLAPMWQALAVKYPDMEKNRAFVMRPLLDSIVGDLGPIVLIAFAATGVLLVLAIVNVVNLWLARAASRAREVAVRTALGATTARLVRQLIGESLVIAFTATIVGVPLAYAAVRTIVLIGGRSLPRVDGMSVDPRVCAFAVAVMLVAGVVIGLAPLLTMAKPNLTEITNEGGRSGMSGRATRRALGLMIVAEVTLAIALVAGAGRLLLSMQHLLAIDPGFTPEGRLAIDVLLAGPKYRDPATLAAWSQQADEQLRAAGATQVASASTLPLRHEWDSTTFTDIADHPTDPAQRPNGRFRIVSPSFFHVMGMRIVAGRSFSVDDRRDGAPVVIVNQAWVRKFIPDLDPLRQRIGGLFGRVTGQTFVALDAAIVGVAADVPYSDLTKAAEPMVFTSDTQRATPRQTLVITSADGHPERLAAPVRLALARIDPRVPVDVELMSDAVATSLIWPKLGLLLMATFGGAALVLAATGVFGVIAFVTTQRLNEMAVRLALGGTSGHVFGLVVRNGAQLALQGALAGLLLAWWTGHLMDRYVYRVSAGSPAVLAGSAAVVLAVAIGATLPSAHRASVISPAAELRR